ncbi:unnamed protein product [Arctia plantaginis]|uniref:Uncharacterized protein n=1 Tax=Arctia plantaginis TaxID=874455 RepID=A0A8S1B2W7_ARCPL|nr:unnamed protein product [Arctia plantaginis]
MSITSHRLDFLSLLLKNGFPYEAPVSVTLTFLLPIDVRVEQLSRVLHAAYRVRVRRVQRAHLAPRRQQLARHLRVLLRQPHLHLYTHSALSTDTLTDRPYSAPPAARATPARAPAPAAPPSVHTLGAQHRHTHRPSLQRAASSSRDTCACSCASRTSICTHTQALSTDTLTDRPYSAPPAARATPARAPAPAAPPSVHTLGAQHRHTHRPSLQRAASSSRDTCACSCASRTSICTHTRRSAQTHSQTVPTARRQQLARHLRVLLRQPHLHLYTHSALSTDTLTDRPYSAPPAARATPARAPAPAAPPSVHTLRRSAQTHSQTVPTARRQQLARHLRVLLRQPHLHLYTHSALSTDTLTDRPYSAPPAARATPARAPAPAAPPSVHTLGAQHRHTHRPSLQRAASSSRDTCACSCASRTSICTHTRRSAQTHSQTVPTARRQQLARHLRVLLRQPHLHLYTHSALSTDTLTDRPYSAPPAARATPARAPAPAAPPSVHTLGAQHRHTHRPSLQRAASSSRDTCACSCASRTSICTHTRRSAQTHSQTVPTARRQQLARHLRVLLRQPHLHLYTHSALSTDTLTDRPYSAPPALSFSFFKRPMPREACTNVLNNRHDADHHRHRRSMMPREQNSQIIDTRFYQPYF